MMSAVARGKLSALVEERLMSLQSQMAAARQCRGILAFGLLLFLAGTAWSATQMNLSWSRLNWTSVGMAMLLMMPSVWLNAVELQLCARVADGRMGMAQALRHSNIATLANLLPLPGSVLVRGGALMKSGASLRISGKIVVAAGLTWLGIATSISFAAAMPSEQGFFVAATALLPVIAIMRWVARRSGINVALGFIAVRLGLLAFMGARLFYCFAAIGVTTAPAEVAVYTVASVLGSVAGVVPAGLGVSEGIAAVLALLVESSPVSAFISVGLNRVLGFVASALIVLFFLWRPQSQGQN